MFFCIQVLKITVHLHALFKNNLMKMQQERNNISEDKETNASMSFAMEAWELCTLSFQFIADDPCLVALNKKQYKS